MKEVKIMKTISEKTNDTALDSKIEDMKTLIKMLKHLTARIDAGLLEKKNEIRRNKTKKNKQETRSF